MISAEPNAHRSTNASVAAPAAIELRGVHKSFGDVHAVNGVDLTVQSGEIVAFLGPNGAGKTTTIDMILGFSTPTSGTAQVYGMKPDEAISRGLVSAVMQTGGLLKDFTVDETLRYTASVFSSTEPIAEVMARAGIADLAGRMVGKCSGGEQQRIRFAMALLCDPELLLLDEPTQGMDVEGRRDFWAAIRGDAQKGRTVMFATHYLEEADLYADRVVVIRKGEIVADGTSAQIKAMGSGRTVNATIPGLTEALVKSIPAVDSFQVRGERLVITSQNTDEVARYLLTQTSAHDIEIIAQGLEDAFLALTGDQPNNSQKESS
ncbi:MAG: ABC transporter ATP-binding protein [Antricoccus sp.]